MLVVRGDRPGLVHIISAMEACNTYKPWHDKQTHRTFLRPDTGKCLHYYFYFIDAELGPMERDLRPDPVPDALWELPASKARQIKG